MSARTLADVPLRVMSSANPGGIGHKWVKARFVDPKTSEGRPFIPAKLADNPHLDQESYRASLAQLDEVTRRQLEHGEWIQDTTGLVYSYADALNGIDALPERSDWIYALSVDLGASEIKPTTSFTVGAFCPHLKQVFVAESEVRAGMIPSTISERTRELETQYGGFESMIMDIGALGKGYQNEIQRRWSLPFKAAEKQNKLGYRKLLKGALQRGEVLIVRDTNSELIEELGELPWNEAGTDSMPGFEDHLTDGLLYLWRECRGYMAKELVERPARGTAEHLALEEAELMRSHIKQHTDEGEPRWKKTRQRRR